MLEHIIFIFTRFSSSVS